MDDRQQFGQNLKKLRKAAGITQDTLAKALLTSRTNITRWEQGERIPDMGMLHQIVEFFGISLQDLFASGRPRHQETIPTVFVLEKEDTCRDQTVRLVSEELPEAEVLGFPTAESALSAAEANEVWIAFIEPRLPGTDGIEFARALLRLYPKANLIFLSSTGDYMADALSLYASGYVMKPLTPYKLKRELGNLRHPAIPHDPI